MPNKDISKVYLADIRKLAFFQEQATPSYWDEHWQIDDLGNYIRKVRSDGTFIPLVKKYLPLGSTILEGGCGRGQLVHALQYQGYKAIGIDSALKTVNEVKRIAPNLDIRYGDVRSLDIESNSLNGYISVGVIEHFWEGYHGVLSEMYRTLKLGGFLFVSFPSLSPLRKLKINLHLFPFSTSALAGQKADFFYQYALDFKTVSKEISNLGFKLLEIKHSNGIKGFKDEVIFFRHYLQRVYDGKEYKQLRPWLERALRSFAYHSTLLVMKKNG